MEKKVKGKDYRYCKVLKSKYYRLGLHPIVMYVILQKFTKNLMAARLEKTIGKNTSIRSIKYIFKIKHL